MHLVSLRPAGGVDESAWRGEWTGCTNLHSGRVLLCIVSGRVVRLLRNRWSDIPQFSRWVGYVKAKARTLMRKAFGLQ